MVPRLFQTSDTTLSANQIAFVNLIVEQLTHNGTIDLELLYQDPFVGYAPTGPENLFTGAQISSLFMALQKVNASAVAS